MPAAKKSTRKCAAPKRKPAAKRKSSTTTRRKLATATRSRSRSCSSSRCSTPRLGASDAGCRSSYMRTDTGRCGPVACVDSNGLPLRGYVRDSQGNCAPKKCGAGYVFNPATGKCVSQNTYAGQHLLAVNKFNNAVRAKDEAEAVMNGWKDADVQATFKKMTGNNDHIAGLQQGYLTDRQTYEKERNKQYQDQLKKLREYNQKRASASAASCQQPYMPFASDSSNPWVRMGMM